MTTLDPQSVYGTGRMSGTFSCCPVVCQPCGTAAEQIQRAPVTSWGDRIDQLAEPVRECVRDYLRGIWMRAQVIARVRA